ncbi:MAG TPA: cupin domain-containing protein [Acetobacteraceae bacterium]|nr:cupin domain-containing protein [Acetobacteraceae bacterium]
MDRFDETNNGRSGLHRLGAIMGVAMLAFAPSLTLAESCPAGSAEPNVRAADHTPAFGVTDTVVGSVDLAKEPAHIEGRLLRLRRLVIQPGGVVPWHSHGDRPAIIYIISGTIEEYASNCSVPIVHRAGDVTVETHGTSHWWKNTGTETVVLLSADLFPEKSDAHTM